jgi:DNA-binding PadR family transcriptional regulator
METKLTTAELGVLGLLTDGEHSGYDVHQRAARTIGYIWTPAKSQVYKVLPRLVAYGLASRRDVAQATRPDKQLYRITPAGREALRAWVEAVEPAREATRDAVLLKIFFGRLAGAEVVAQHVDALRAHDAALVEVWEQMEQRGIPDPYELATLRYGIARARATLAWAEAVARQLRELRPKSPARAGR